MKYFTIQELYRSNEATKRRIDNTPPPGIKVQLSRLVTEVLDPLRDAWGAPLTVNSGYRSPVLNKIVGGVPTSQHQAGQAADITAGSPEKNKQLFELAKHLIGEGKISVGQLIDEKKYTWLHISTPTDRLKNEIKHL